MTEGGSRFRVKCKTLCNLRQNPVLCSFKLPYIKVMFKTCCLLITLIITSSSYATMRESRSAIHAGKFCQGFSKYGVPDAKHPSDIYLCRDGYMVGYNMHTKDPNWVEYRLTGTSVSGHIKRHNDFAPDMTIPTRYRAELSDYRRSGYDRGHLAPYAAMDFNKESAKQSFLLSNMAPQKPGLNRQGWARLERDVRIWAKSFGEVYVVTGVIYKNHKPHKFIGRDHVAVPDYFYKIIYAPKQHKSIAFVMPNTRIAKSKVANYRDSIADIEKRTGDIFLTKISEHERSQLINHVSKMWPTSKRQNKLFPVSPSVVN